MKAYKNLAGNVGICSYELGDRTIRIRFHSHKHVVYDHQNAGEAHVNKLSALATQGFGLSDYINDNELRGIVLD